MKYFLSIDNNYYHRWQAELLIESFKYNSLEKDLFIFITNKDASTVTGYSKNLLKHKQKYFHDSNVDLYLNKLNSLKYFNLNNVDDSICILHPDMLLYKTISIDIDRDIITSYDPQTESLKDLMQDELSFFVKTLDYLPKWTPCGEIVIFNKLSEIYDDLILSYKKMSKRDLLLARQGCWIYSIMKNHYINGKTLKIEALEQNLMHHNLDNNFINYKHGVGSAWNKHQFKRPDMILGISGPYESFLKLEATTSSIDYMKTIINNYLND